MEVIIKITPEETAALVLAIQERRPVDDSFVDEIWSKVLNRLDEAYKHCGTQ